MLVSRVGDMVVTTWCGVVPIISGTPMFLEGGLPIATIGSAVACGGVIISGTPTHLNVLPVSRMGDVVACPGCGAAIVISGTPTYLQV